MRLFLQLKSLMMAAVISLSSKTLCKIPVEIGKQDFIKPSIREGGIHCRVDREGMADNQEKLHGLMESFRWFPGDDVTNPGQLHEAFTFRLPSISEDIGAESFIDQNHTGQKPDFRGIFLPHPHPFRPFKFSQFSQTGDPMLQKHFPGECDMAAILKPGGG